MKTLRFWMAAMMLGTTLLGLAAAADATTDDQAAIKKLLNDLAAAFGAKDIDRIMSFYVPDESLFVFDSIPPRQYVGAKAWRKDCEG
ncbi:MAG: hypothetical protein E6I48_07855, partial [Chloroflexi bacterium]